VGRRSRGEENGLVAPFAPYRSSLISRSCADGVPGHRLRELKNGMTGLERHTRLMSASHLLDVARGFVLYHLGLKGELEQESARKTSACVMVGVRTRKDVRWTTGSFSSQERHGLEESNWTNDFAGWERPVARWPTRPGVSSQMRPMRLNAGVHAPPLLRPFLVPFECLGLQCRED
jgi:hypothetical protein